MDFVNVVAYRSSKFRAKEARRGSMLTWSFK